MKKILSAIVAIALCLTLSVCAFAQDAVSDDVLSNVVDGVTDLVNAETEGDDAALEDAINNLYAELEKAEVATDAATLAELLAKYAEGADVDASAVFSDLGALQDVVEKFLVDGGIDMEAVKGDLQESSALNTLVGLYTGAYTQTPEVPEEPTVDEPVVENPSTGDSATGVVVALATLAVSAAAAVVLSKKED